jgi:hypothetical protein
MKKANIISKVIAIGSLIVLTSTNSFAHSGHDFSKLPMKWEFTKETKAKIENILKVNRYGVSAIGTSRLEQKFFDDYNVDVGNSFLAQVNGKTITLQRTSSGILIVEVHRFSNTAVPQIPVQKAMEIKKVSMNSHHQGHDHTALPYQWIFSKKTQSKISEKVASENFPIAVGLSSHERKMLKKYDINVGNTFKAVVGGKPLNIKKTSGGLFVEEEKGVQVASIAQEEAM